MFKMINWIFFRLLVVYLWIYLWIFVCLHFGLCRRSTKTHWKLLKLLQELQEKYLKYDIDRKKRFMKMNIAYKTSSHNYKKYK